MMKRIFVFLLLSIGACAPKPEAKPSPESQVQFEFGPRGQDASLDLSNLNQQTKPSSNVWLRPQDLSEEKKLQFFESLLVLGLQTQSSSLRSAALTETLHFRDQKQVANVKFEESPYVDAIVGSTFDEATTQLSEALGFLPQDLQTMQVFLADSLTLYPWPQAALPAHQLSPLIKNYLRWLVEQLPSLDLSEPVEQNLMIEIPKRSEGPTQIFSSSVERILAATHSLERIGAIRRLIADLNQQVNVEDLRLLAKGEKLAKETQALHDEQDVLTLIVHIWGILDAKERKTVIGGESWDLYEFLRDATDYNMECLARRGCKDPYIWLAKKMKIFPQIEKRGVKKIKTLIETSMNNYILESFSASATQALREVPKMISDEVTAGIQGKIFEIRGILSDYAGFVRGVARQWSEKKLQASRGLTRGFEQDLALAPMNSGSSLIGIGLLLKTKLLNVEAAQMAPGVRAEWMIEQLNKLLALGGYKKNKTEKVQGLNQALDGRLDFRMTLEDLLGSSFSFAVPDRLILSSAFTARPAAQKDLNVSVVGQAQLLRGFSEAIKWLRDFQSTSFDSTLGPEVLGGILADSPASLAERKIFPKESMYALAVGNASVILKNLLKDLSPVFVFADEGTRIIWANEYQLGDNEASAMAGVVNLIAGQRDLRVSSLDISEYLLALSEFVEAIQGVENTKSEPILKGEPGDRGLDQLIKAQDQIKILVVGLANFLSHKMTDDRGWVRDIYSVRSRSFENDKVQVLTQFRSLQALLRAYKMTRVGPYLWSAIELYYKLNREIFDSHIGFYKGVQSLDEGVQILSILKELEPFLPRDSQNQLSRLATAWTALAEVRVQVP